MPNRLTQITLRVREALTASRSSITSGSSANPEVLAWFREKYGISEETIARLKIGFAANMASPAWRAR